MYCPKCKSRLYPEDEKYMMSHGVCSYCATYAKPKSDSCFYCGQKSDNLREVEEDVTGGEYFDRVLACPSCSHEVDKENNAYA